MKPSGQKPKQEYKKILIKWRKQEKENFTREAMNYAIKETETWYKPMQLKKLETDQLNDPDTGWQLKSWYTVVLKLCNKVNLDEA